jgi:hypothetical protein
MGVVVQHLRAGVNNKFDTVPIDAQSNSIENWKHWKIGHYMIYIALRFYIQMMLHDMAVRNIVLLPG